MYQESGFGINVIGPHVADSKPGICHVPAGAEDPTLDINCRAH
jgi:hypothetical protein